MAALSGPQSIESCLFHCAISATAKNITDLTNLLKSIVVIMFEISVYTKLDLYW